MQKISWIYGSLALGLWLITAILFGLAPTQIVWHIAAGGQIDRWGSRWVLWAFPTIFSIIMAGLLWGAQTLRRGPHAVRGPQLSSLEKWWLLGLVAFAIACIGTMLVLVYHR